MIITLRSPLPRCSRQGCRLRDFLRCSRAAPDARRHRRSGFRPCSTPRSLYLSEAPSPGTPVPAPGSDRTLLWPPRRSPKKFTHRAAGNPRLRRSFCSVHQDRYCRIHWIEKTLAYTSFISLISAIIAVIRIRRSQNNGHCRGSFPSGGRRGFGSAHCSCLS